MFNMSTHVRPFAPIIQLSLVRRGALPRVADVEYFAPMFLVDGRIRDGLGVAG